MEYVGAGLPFISFLKIGQNGGSFIIIARIQMDEGSGKRFLLLGDKVGLNNVIVSVQLYQSLN